MAAPDTFNLFIYGSLRDPRVFEEAAGIPCPDTIPAVLEGYAPGPAVEGYPAVVPELGGRVAGEVILALPATILARLDEYEGEGELYRRVSIRVTAGNREIDAYVYIRRPEE
ncbi:MAG: gamma-glutamylcyclotransferase [bacterium]